MSTSKSTILDDVCTEGHIAQVEHLSETGLNECEWNLVEHVYKCCYWLIDWLIDWFHQLPMI